MHDASGFDAAPHRKDFLEARAHLDHGFAEDEQCVRNEGDGPHQRPIDQFGLVPDDLVKLLAEEVDVHLPRLIEQLKCDRHHRAHTVSEAISRNQRQSVSEAAAAARQSVAPRQGAQAAFRLRFSCLTKAPKVQQRLVQCLADALRVLA